MSAPPVWLFDLDNTLHNASPHIFPHINRSMTAYLEQHLSLSHEAANTLRMQYWQRYGATLSGLIRHHGTDPHHFLQETHRFEQLHELMVFERALGAMLRRLPGRKIVFSNAPRVYADAVLATMGIAGRFDSVVGIEQLGFHPKPSIEGYRRLLHHFGLNPRQCVMVEDTAVNLKTARRLGMRTVWVSRSLRRPSYVDIKISNVLALRRACGHLLGSV